MLASIGAAEIRQQLPLGSSAAGAGCRASLVPTARRGPDRGHCAQPRSPGIG
jgi:hypothetical protein